MESRSVKIVGKRRGLAVTYKTVNDFLWMVVQLRGGKPFIPKGVHRFQSHEENQKWSIRMMARRPNDVEVSKCHPESRHSREEGFD